MESPKMVKLNRIVSEARGIKTFLFNFEFERVVEPGQFVMVWLPGVDEIPLALSHITLNGEAEHGVTVASVGDATEKFHALDREDWIGVRGPYGKGFDFGDYKEILVVGGGIGMAPLAPAVESALKAGARVQVAVGAKTADDLLFVERVKHAGADTMVCTDDGSAGEKCLATELASDMIARNGFELVLGCGPEPMLAKLVELCSEKGLPVQVSLERYMKCGVGICDSCALDGRHVCVDGPVFSGENLSNSNEFGKWKRDGSGRKIRI
jgi:dihydroorotate dehydrogenase electron transfer subunit